MVEVDYQWRNRRKLYLQPPHRYLKQELARISMPMDGPYFDERDEEEELVISEVLLGCPPDSAGPHISHFTISIPPDVDISRSMDLFNDEGVLTHQKICVDEDGDLVLARRN